MLTINIPEKEYIEMLNQLEKEFGWKAADLVHLTLSNRMTPESRDKVTLALMQAAQEKERQNE